MSKLWVVHGASCEADGHPGECQATVSGETKDGDGDTSVTINGVPVTDHNDSMYFDPHAHNYVETDDGGYCDDYYSHELTPDQNPDITINGQPIIRVGDSTSDPGAGTATVLNSGGNGAVTHTE